MNFILFLVDVSVDIPEDGNVATDDLNIQEEKV